MPDEVYHDPAGMHDLSTRLGHAASDLDEAAAGAPGAPDAGASTAVVGELLASMSAVLGDYVTSIGVAAAGVVQSEQTMSDTDRVGAGSFTASME